MHCKLAFQQWDCIILVWQEENIIEIYYTNKIIMENARRVRATLKFSVLMNKIVQYLHDSKSLYNICKKKFKHQILQTLDN